MIFLSLLFQDRLRWLRQGNTVHLKDREHPDSVHDDADPQCDMRQDEDTPESYPYSDK
jgi:hypothetical protein